MSSRPFTFGVPAGLHRVEELIDLATRVRSTGKDIRLQAYDTLQGLQWNGGRLLFNKAFLKSNVENWYTPLTAQDLREAVQRVKRLNEAGIGFNLTFNNTLESLDVEDEDGNELLRLLEDPMNGVTVATEGLRSHVAQYYPKYELTASICFAYDKPEQMARACERYHKVVALPIFAYVPELLTGLPMEKLVFIVNDDCYLFCTRKDHYANISRCSLAGNSTVQEQAMNKPKGDCLGADPRFRERLRREGDAVLIQRIEGIRKAQLAAEGLDSKHMEHNFTVSPAARRSLLSLGVTQFKLQGRDYPNEVYRRKVTDFLEKMVREEL